MSWFDSHCHLHICEEEGGPVEEVLARARSAGVDEMVAVGIDVASSAPGARAGRIEGVVASAGVHPNSANEWDDRGRRRRSKSCWRSRRCARWARRGLDFYRDWVEPEVQHGRSGPTSALSKRLDKALDHPHARLDGGGHRRLEGLGPPPPARLPLLVRRRRCAAAGAGPGRVHLVRRQRLVQECRGPAARGRPWFRPTGCSVETDSPYLAPVPHRGKPNEPAFVAHVGEAVAAARGHDVGRDRRADDSQRARALPAVTLRSCSGARALRELAREPRPPIRRSATVRTSSSTRTRSARSSTSRRSAR